MPGTSRTRTRGTSRTKGLAMVDSQRAAGTVASGTAEVHPLQIEANGINVITDAQRNGRPSDLFWPWFAANVSVLGLSYGSFELGFGISFWQGTPAGPIGIVPPFPPFGFIPGGGQGGP